MTNKTLSDEIIEDEDDINDKYTTIYVDDIKKHLQEFKEELIKKLTSPCALHCETLGIINTQMQKHFGDKLI